MDYKKIIKKTESFGEQAYFVGRADESVIRSIEQVLEVSLPTSYKWFLTEIGLAIIPGFIIKGNGLGPKPACVKSTLEWREYGLPKKLLVIEDEGTDWIYCLDTSRMLDGECPVVDWEQDKGIGQEFFESFYDYFDKRLNESLTMD